MKKVILTYFVLLLTIHIDLNSQSCWQWGYQGTNAESCNPKLSAFDHLNNSYSLFPYGNTIDFKDTIFNHEGTFYNNANFAIVKHDQNGNYLNAIDVFCPTNEMLFQRSELIVDDELNIYLAIGIQDSIFINENIFVPKTNYGDIILIKFNSQFELLWEQQIYGTDSYNQLRGLFIADDNNIFLEAQTEWSPSGNRTVNFFDQDTAEYSYGLISVMKIDSTGELKWRKEIRSTNIEYMSLYSTVGENGSYYCLGIAEHTIIVDGDSIFPLPDTLSRFYFDVAFKPNGQVLHSLISYLNVQYHDKLAYRNGDYFFSSSLNDTIIFGNDTIYSSPESPTLLIGRMDTLYNPIWYEKLTGEVNYSYRFKLDLKDDILYFSTNCINSFEFVDVAYIIGNKQSVLNGTFTTNGELIKTELSQSSNSVFVQGIHVDNSNNTFMSGYFQGEIFAGMDTLIQNNISYEDGFIAKINDNGLSDLDLGNDTTITISEFIILEIKGNFTNPFWSTGDTTNLIFISGDELQIGRNDIWVKAFRGSCFATDTIMIFVIDNSITPENKYSEFYFFPNPVTSTLNFYSKSGSNLNNIKIFNQLGEQVIIQETFNNNIDFTKYSNGIYFIEFEYKDKVLRRKIIVSK